MTTIDMDTDFARMQSGNLGNVIEKLTEIRKALINQAEAMPVNWQSGSATEFQDLHTTEMSKMWSMIQTLIQLNNQLNAAIEIAEKADQDLSG